MLPFDNGRDGELLQERIPIAMLSLRILWTAAMLGALGPAVVAAQARGAVRQVTRGTTSGGHSEAAYNSSPQTGVVLPHAQTDRFLQPLPDEFIVSPHAVRSTSTFGCIHVVDVDHCDPDVEQCYDSSRLKESRCGGIFQHLVDSTYRCRLKLQRLCRTLHHESFYDPLPPFHHVNYGHFRTSWRRFPQQHHAPSTDMIELTLPEANAPVELVNPPGAPGSAPIKPDSPPVEMGRRQIQRPSRTHGSRRPIVAPGYQTVQTSRRQINRGRPAVVLVDPPDEHVDRPVPPNRPAAGRERDHVKPPLLLPPEPDAARVIRGSRKVRPVSSSRRVAPSGKAADIGYSISDPEPLFAP